MHNANYTKEMNSNEDIFQLEIKSKQFLQRGSIHQERSLNKGSLIVQQEELDFSTIGTFPTNTNVTSRSLNTSWLIFIEQLVNTFVKWYRKCTISTLVQCTCKYKYHYL